MAPAPAAIPHDLAHLSTFMAVVRTRGFGRAADRLGLSQSAVSHRIARLEEQLGTPLFEEPRRRLILTDAGTALLDVCGRFLTELDALSVSVTEGRVASGPLRIACAGAFGRYVVFPALLECAALRGTPVHLLYRPLDDILDLVESGEADVGIAYDQRVTRTLSYARVAREEFCLIARPDDAPPADAGLGEMERARWVAYEEGDFVFGRWFEQVYGASPRRLNAELTFSRLEEVIRAVVEGRGWSIVPRHAVVEELSAGRLHRFAPGARPRCLNTEYAVTRPGWRRRPEVEALLVEVTRIAGAAHD